MTPFPWIDVAVIGALVLVNAAFAMSEMAIVSARPARLRLAAERGRKGAAVALDLAADPGRFLSTAQSGITLIGVVAGAFSGVSLEHPIAERLVALGLPARWEAEAGFVVAIVATTYLNLVVGELVPKQLALRAAEPIAIFSARPMAAFARVAAPLVWLLDRSSGVLLRLIGVRAHAKPELTEEELHLMFHEATRSGVIEEEERALMTGIMRLADRPVREVMTPRTEIDSLDKRASEAEIRAAIKASPHSLLPVTDGSPDRIVGVVKVREVLALLLAGKRVQLARLMRQAEVVPDQLDAMDALRALQQADVAMALVHDEYGHLEGIVTPADLLAAIVGSFASHQDEGEGPLLAEAEDGALLVAGALPADVLASRLGIELPDERDYATAAGFALSVLKRLPASGESFTAEGWRFEVLAMDGRRIEQLRVRPEPAAADG
ncbi:MAG: HlyC/CorC family transporter [Proteobacteria bacterium]|nr:HlyC/CorC family transporter [Pseudomonadota bacterium]